MARYWYPQGGFLLIECMIALCMLMSTALITCWYHFHTMHYQAESLIRLKALRKAQQIIDRAVFQGIITECYQEDNVTAVCTCKPLVYEQDEWLKQLSLMQVTVEVYWQSLCAKRSSCVISSVMVVPSNHESYI